MKILEVIPKLQSGGAEKFVVDLTNEFVKTSHNCTLLTLFDLDKYDILRTHLTNDVKTHSIGKKRGVDFKCMFRLYQYIRKEKPEVVHAHVGAITYLILTAVLHRKCKYFATIHSEAKREANGGINKLIRNFLFKLKLVHPITISEESEKSFYNFYKEHGILIPNGCSDYCKKDENITIQWRKDTDFLFIHVGRLQKVKNQIALVKAFQKILDDGIRARLLILGRKEDELVYEKIKPYFSDNIVYLGEQSDCRAYMSECDAFCLTSTMEGMPITIIEAFSVGCPPIVTPVGGCTNIVKDNYNGIIAKDCSETSIYDALKRFIELSNDKRLALSKIARNTYIENYSISKVSRKYLTIFSKIFNI